MFSTEILDNKFIYRKKTENDNVELTWFKDSIIDEAHPFGYDVLVLKYNQFKGKYKFSLFKDSQMFDILGIDKTDLFCNREYIVISVVEYREISNSYAENNYTDFYIAMDDNSDEFSGAFNYNLLNVETRGPVSLEIINKMVQHKCTNHNIEFQY